MDCTTEMAVITREVASPSPERLGRIVRRRIEWARRSEGPVPKLDDALLHALVERHGDDIRGIEGQLYNLFQRLQDLRTLTPDDLALARS